MGIRDWLSGAKATRRLVTNSTLDPSIKSQLDRQDILDHLLYGKFLATMVTTKDTKLCEILETKKIRCLHCGVVATCGTRNPSRDKGTNEVTISCPTCGKPWVSLKYT